VLASAATLSWRGDGLGAWLRSRLEECSVVWVWHWLLRRKTARAARSISLGLMLTGFLRRWEGHCMNMVGAGHVHQMHAAPAFLGQLLTQQDRETSCPGVPARVLAVHCAVLLAGMALSLM